MKISHGRPQHQETVVCIDANAAPYLYGYCIIEDSDRQYSILSNRQIRVPPCGDTLIVYRLCNVDHHPNGGVSPLVFPDSPAPCLTESGSFLKTDDGFEAQETPINL